MDRSEEKIWELAVEEWEIVDFEEDQGKSQSCICGKENIVYLFKIKNKLNDNILYPIGSSCIRKFENDELTDQARIKEKLFKLLSAIEHNQFIELSSEFFSRKLLQHLHYLGAFRPTKWNNFMPHVDYAFLLDMFNKKSRTEAQNRKATAIILNSIKPFLQQYLANKRR